jgi:hypothetical protein
LAAAVLCSQVSNKDLVGTTAYNLILWYGSMTCLAILLFAGCAVARAEVDRERESAGVGLHPQVNAKPSLAVPAHRVA